MAWTVVVTAVVIGYEETNPNLTPSTTSIARLAVQYPWLEPIPHAVRELWAIRRESEPQPSSSNRIRSLQFDVTLLWTI